MTRRKLFVSARRARGATIAGLISLSLLTSSGGVAAGAATPVPPVVLRGQGAWSIFEMTIDIHNGLDDSAKPIDSKYTLPVPTSAGSTS